MGPENSYSNNRLKGLAFIIVTLFSYENKYKFISKEMAAQLPPLLVLIYT